MRKEQFKNLESASPSEILGPKEKEKEINFPRTEEIIKQAIEYEYIDLEEKKIATGTLTPEEIKLLLDKYSDDISEFIFDTVGDLCRNEEKESNEKKFWIIQFAKELIKLEKNDLLVDLIYAVEENEIDVESIAEEISTELSYKAKENKKIVEDFYFELLKEYDALRRDVEFVVLKLIASLGLHFLADSIKEKKWEGKKEVFLKFLENLEESSKIEDFDNKKEIEIYDYVLECLNSAGNICLENWDEEFSPEILNKIINILNSMNEYAGGAGDYIKEIEKKMRRKYRSKEEKESSKPLPCQFVEELSALITPTDKTREQKLNSIKKFIQDRIGKSIELKELEDENTVIRLSIDELLKEEHPRQEVNLRNLRKIIDFYTEENFYDKNFSDLGFKGRKEEYYNQIGILADLILKTKAFAESHLDSPYSYQEIIQNLSIDDLSLQRWQRTQFKERICWFLINKGVVEKYFNEYKSKPEEFYKLLSGEYPVEEVTIFPYPSVIKVQCEEFDYNRFLIKEGASSLASEVRGTFFPGLIGNIDLNGLIFFTKRKEKESTDIHEKAHHIFDQYIEWPYSSEGCLKFWINELIAYTSRSIKRIQELSDNIKESIRIYGKPEDIKELIEKVDRDELGLFKADGNKNTNEEKMAEEPAEELLAEIVPSIYIKTLSPDIFLEGVLETLKTLKEDPLEICRKILDDLIIANEIISKMLRKIEEKINFKLIDILDGDPEMVKETDEELDKIVAKLQAVGPSKIYHLGHELGIGVTRNEILEYIKKSQKNFYNKRTEEFMDYLKKHLAS